MPTSVARFAAAVCRTKLGGIMVLLFLDLDYFVMKEKQLTLGINAREVELFECGADSHVDV
jgi:hypothetical protein